MQSLKSNSFRMREELCDWVNDTEKHGPIEIVQIVATSTMFILFYREGE